MSDEVIEVQFGDLPTLNFLCNESHSKYFFHRDWWIDGRYVHELPVGLQFVKHVRSAAIVLDIGANLGWYTVLAAKSAPNIPIHSFEMDANNFGLLSDNIRLNRAANVTAHHLAVSDCDGTGKYSDVLSQGSDSRSGLHLSATVNTEGDGLLTVETVTLGGQFESLHGAVIKIDVEGAEQNVLLGARYLLEQSAKIALFIEVHPDKILDFGYLTEDLIRLLIECGFRVMQIVNMRSTDRDAVIEAVAPTDVLPMPHALIYATKGNWSVC